MSPEVVLGESEAMTRREFIVLVGGIAAAWPLAARAQQREPPRWIAILEPIAKDTPGASLLARIE